MSDKPQTHEWQSDCGRVRIYRGNCLEVMPEFDPESVDMIWTDPPYGHNNADGDFLSNRHNIMVDGRGKTQQPIQNDSMIDMRRIVDGMLIEAERVMRHDCCCCCCCCGGGGGPKPTFAWLAQRMDENGLSFFHSVIWDKKNPGIGWRYRRQHEMIMIAHRRGGRLSWSQESVKQPNIIRLSKPRADLHPNEKPIELCERFIELHTAPNAIILDPFMGSGTTGVAAVQLGRKFIGIELAHGYFEIAKDRIKKALYDADTDLFGPMGETTIKPGELFDAS